MSAKKANDILQKANSSGGDGKTRTRKRNRRQRYEGEETTNSETDASEDLNEAKSSFIAEGTEAYKALLLASRLRFARYFALIYEDEINEILVKVLGKNILKEESADSYDHAYEKVKRWGRQWQHEILRALTRHVQAVAKDCDELLYMSESEVREYFHLNINIYSLKAVFHILAQDVDLDKIFQTQACELYCTMYCNMCFYVWEVRVRHEHGNIKKAEEKELFARFRLLAREKTFDNVRVEHIPRPPPKPVSKKRTKIGELTPLSTSDSNFKVFGLPPAISFVATQLAQNFQLGHEGQQQQQQQQQQPQQQNYQQQNYQQQQQYPGHAQQAQFQRKLNQRGEFDEEVNEEVGEITQAQVQVPATQFHQQRAFTGFQNAYQPPKNTIQLPTDRRVNHRHGQAIMPHQGQQGQMPSQDGLFSQGAYVPSTIRPGVMGAPGVQAA